MKRSKALVEQAQALSRQARALLMYRDTPGKPEALLQSQQVPTSRRGEKAEPPSGTP